MKRRQLLAIFTALAVSLCSAALLVGCAGKTVYYTDFAYDETGKPIPAGDQVSLVSTNEDGASSSAGASSEESAEAPAEESSETPAAEPSSEAPAEESSETPAAEPSSEAPAEESSETPAAEPSSEAPAAEGVVVKFQKPTDGAWASKNEVFAYVYNGNDKDQKNADYPGVQMTDNGDGTFSYTVPGNIENPTVIFNCNTEKTKYPRSGSLAVENGKTYTVE